MSAAWIDVALRSVHLLCVVLWVGGMVFAHFFLRPALGVLEPPQRLRLMHAVLQGFFRAVLVASLLTAASGLALIGRAAARTVQAGASFQMPLAWSVMATLGLVMVGIFLHIRFAPFVRLARAVAAAQWPEGAAALAQIRRWVGVNLVLGLLVLLVALLRSLG